MEWFADLSAAALPAIAALVAVWLTNLNGQWQKRFEGRLAAIASKRQLVQNAYELSHEATGYYREKSADMIGTYNRFVGKLPPAEVAPAERLDPMHRLVALVATYFPEMHGDIEVFRSRTVSIWKGKIEGSHDDKLQELVARQLAGEAAARAFVDELRPKLDLAARQLAEAEERILAEGRRPSRRNLRLRLWRRQSDEAA